MSKFFNSLFCLTIFSSFAGNAFFSPFTVELLEVMVDVVVFALALALEEDFFSNFDFDFARLIGFSFDKFDPIDGTLSTALRSFCSIDLDFFSLFSDSSLGFELLFAVLFALGFLLGTDFADGLLERDLMLVFCLVDVAAAAVVVFFVLGFSDFVSEPPVNLVWGFLARILSRGFISPDATVKSGK